MIEREAAGEAVSLSSRFLEDTVNGAEMKHEQHIARGLCPWCEGDLERRGHSPGKKLRMAQLKALQKGTYYFAYWYVCTDCQRMYNDDKAKVLATDYTADSVYEKRGRAR